MDWVLGSIGAALDVIQLRGITAYGHHGMTPEERQAGQIFLVDVAIHLDTRAAAAADDLTQTMDYGVVARQVVGLISGSPSGLLETVAARVAEEILQLEPVQVVDVVIHKPAAPLGVQVEDVMVSVRRSAEGAASTFVTPDSAMFEAVHQAEREAGLATPPPGQARLDRADASPSGEVDLGDDGDSASAAGDQRRRRHDAHAEEVAAVDQVPSGPVDAIVALGANLGEALNTLRSALSDLREEPGIEVVAVSPLARTAPVGRPDQPDFFNAVTHIRTTLSPRTLLHTLQGVEEKHGRQRAGRWAPRTLDLDLIAYDTLLADEDELTIPHPRAHERAFVLVPWSLMSPGAFLPGLGGGSVQALADAAPDRNSIRWLAPDWDQPNGRDGAQPYPSTGSVALPAAPAAPPPLPAAEPTAPAQPDPAGPSNWGRGSEAWGEQAAPAQLPQPAALPSPDDTWAGAAAPQAWSEPAPAPAWAEPAPVPQQQPAAPPQLPPAPPQLPAAPQLPPASQPPEAGSWGPPEPQPQTSPAWDAPFSQQYQFAASPQLPPAPGYAEAAPDSGYGDFGSSPGYGESAPDPGYRGAASAPEYRELPGAANWGTQASYPPLSAPSPSGSPSSAPGPSAPGRAAPGGFAPEPVAARLPAPRPASSPHSSHTPGLPNFFAAAREANRSAPSLVVEPADGTELFPGALASPESAQIADDPSSTWDSPSGALEPAVPPGAWVNPAGASSSNSETYWTGAGGQ
ncbi:MAG: 2-amino-4-hydroxy-6-hydroxymethyldihydropteridine diphosphokinase [Bifidobacteriaceae bacterium]|jgi:dihydroneopterin aldolase/2-amino-4-hydroxy-6-hydroxymethyldihydropteridine diphosphokinase|nr:2-amino-4-hydroxy-6-hydroxymethyldihydropteridine diphosphokinase [Bifidobacteriaceae bacterium]